MNNKYSARLLTSESDFIEYQKLRYLTPEYAEFDEGGIPGRESDKHDIKVAFAVGTFDENNQIVAGHRFICHPKIYMFQTEYDQRFSNLELKYQGRNTCEGSRWALRDTEYLKALIKEEAWLNGPTIHLLKKDFEEFYRRGIEYCYTATYPAIIQSFIKCGFPFEHVDTCTLENGVQIELAVLLVNKIDFDNVFASIID